MVEPFEWEKIMTALSTKKPISMIRGTGDGRVTQYSCGVIKQAKADGVKILVVRRDSETGKKMDVLADPRQVHREDPRAVYGDTHELAGQGKFIDLAAYPKGDQTRIVGAQHVNPYLRDEGAYATIIEVLKNDIGVVAQSRLRGRFAHSRKAGTHILWEGKRNSDGFLTCSDWFTREELWTMACSFNPDLLKILRKSSSGVKGAEHKSPKEKFFINLEVLRRATRVIHVINGRQEFCGGKTPYSLPLEQCGFAIDKRFLTCGMEDGEEIGDDFYRLVQGRPEPHILRGVDWKYEGVTTTVAFKDEKTRRIVRKAG